MKKQSITVIFLIFSVIFCLFSSCGFMLNNIDFDQKTFIEQRQLWQESNIQNYQYDLYYGGIFSYNGTIIVEDSNYQNDFQKPGGFPLTMSYSSIDEIYNEIERLYNANDKIFKWNSIMHLVKIFIVYDKINHIPVEIHYEWYVNNFNPEGPNSFYITDFLTLD